MFEYTIRKPSEIEEEHKVSVNIYHENGILETTVHNIFAGVITDYIKDSPHTVIIPVIVGDLTPGMIMSYVSGLVTCAMEMLSQSDIPKDILRDLAHKAVDEGLSSRLVTCKNCYKQN